MLSIECKYHVSTLLRNAFLENRNKRFNNALNEEQKKYFYTSIDYCQK